jgi:glyoxylase-like metal-dependent hydrolase (beta-lactamase superfamily II)
MIHNLAQNVDSFTSNVFLVTGDRTVLVDAGSEFDVVAMIRAHVSALDAVVVTHTHYDHIDNLPAVTDTFDIDVWGYDIDQPGIDHAIRDRGAVMMGDHEYQALHTPGHKDDHLCLYARDPGILFVGDLVFSGGKFGRTDLEEGDREVLVRSLDYVLDTVDDTLDVLHSGHGQSVRTDPYRTIQMAWQAARF